MLEDQRRAESQLEDRAVERLYSYLNRPDEYLDVMRHKDDTKENIRRRIEELRGRRVAYQNHVRSQRVNVQTFDVQRYKRLLEDERDMTS